MKERARNLSKLGDDVLKSMDKEESDKFSKSIESGEFTLETFYTQLKYTLKASKLKPGTPTDELERDVKILEALTPDERKANALFTKRTKGTTRLRVCKQTNLEMTDLMRTLAKFEVYRS